MKTKLWLFLTFCLILPLVFQPNPALAASPMKITSPQDVALNYGFIRDSADPQLVTAVVYPNLTSDDVTISTATWTFLLPAGTVTTPSIAEAPSIGSFNNINGAWNVQKVTPSLYASVGFDAAQLDGHDVYQAVLSPGSATPILSDGQPLPLFSFRIVEGCNEEGSLEILTNDSQLQQNLFDTLGANFNNQMSISVDGMLAMNQYAGNQPGGASLECSSGQSVGIRFFLPLVNR